jgi:hypothetical protein
MITAQEARIFPTLCHTVGLWEFSWGTTEAPVGADLFILLFFAFHFLAGFTEYCFDRDPRFRHSVAVGLQSSGRILKIKA